MHAVYTMAFCEQFILFFACLRTKLIEKHFKDELKRRILEFYGMLMKTLEYIGSKILAVKYSSLFL